MSTFNLLDEPWLPVLDAGTDLRDAPHHPVRFREISLRDAFTRAPEIREVYSDAPLETVALYRLLLALTIDVYLSEADRDDWMALWRQRRFNPTDLECYLAAHALHTHFDLLDPERPFYQHPQPHSSTEGKDPAPLAKLFHAEASGNNATLFGHELDNVPRQVVLAEAARGLVCAQAAALGGGVSKPFNFSHAPLVGGDIFWIRGRSLFDALLLNAPPDNAARMVKEGGFDYGEQDRPNWRQEDLPEEHARRPAAGYLDYLTWQARRLTLVTMEENDRVVATGVFLTQGDKDEPAVGIRDPLMARVGSKTKGVFPFGFRANRALWRDADLLFRIADPNDEGAPLTFQWLDRVAATDYPAEASELEAQGWLVDAFGLATEPGKAGKVAFWRHERFPIYHAFLDDPSRLPDLQRALEFAEEQRGILRGAARTVAEYLLDPPPPGSDDRPSPDQKTVSSLIDGLDVESRYWAMLEPFFYELLRDLARQNEAAARTERLWQWAKDIYDAARRSFEAATSMLDQNARVLRALAEGQRRLGRVKAYREHRKTLQEEPS